MAKDWNTEWQQIDNEQKEASHAYMEAMAAVTKAFAEKKLQSDGGGSRRGR